MIAPEAQVSLEWIILELLTIPNLRHTFLPQLRVQPPLKRFNLSRLKMSINILMEHSVLSQKLKCLKLFVRLVSTQEEINPRHSPNLSCFLQIRWELIVFEDMLEEDTSWVIGLLIEILRHGFEVVFFSHVGPEG